MSEYVEDYPVKNFPLKFEWYTGDWYELFEKQIELIQADIKRALIDDRIVVYLSCPLSSRGGGHSITNVEIARHTEQQIMKEWGTGFWVLNPAQYQMESKEGTGLIEAHARILKIEKNMDIDLDKLKKEKPLDRMGGNYMRMWTRVLVEDGNKNLGDFFSAFYFVGASNVRDFFTLGGSIDLTSGVQEYFSRKYCTDPIFHKYFSEGVDGSPLSKEEWESRRKDFFRFYTIRASANYSKGCHDEWNILKILNNMRVKEPSLGIGSQIAGYFDGRQISPGSSEKTVYPGYSI
ncbi:hypothetical protein ACWNPK_20555 [Bacillus atrophaeus]